MASRLYFYIFRQELNRIDEQFQRERAEREKREEEEEKQRKQREEEALARQEVIGEEMEQASSQMTSALPPAISPRPVNNPGMRPSPAPQVICTEMEITNPLIVKKRY